MTGKRLVELAVVIAMASGCQRKPAPVAVAAPSSDSTAQLSTPRCFSVRADQNSATTRAVFEEKHCQGGGVTWAGIVRLLIKHRGREVEAQVKALNSEKAALEHAMAAANPIELECLPPGTSAGELLAQLEPSPPLSPAEASARQASLTRLRAALERQRTWCFDKRGSVSGGKGGFTLHPDGRATTFGDGQPASEGRWMFEDDGRLQLLTPRHVHHFDASSNGTLGFNHTEGREDLTPCSPTP